MSGAQERMIAAVASDARYVALVTQRSRLGWGLSALIFFAFVSYLLLIAFDKALLGAPIADGVTSLGIPLGVGLILLAIALTAVYVAYANRYLDPQMTEILRAHRERDWGA